MIPEPIPVPITAQIVKCEVCERQMVIALHYAIWTGHPGFRHLDGEPACQVPE